MCYTSCVLSSALRVANKFAILTPLLIALACTAQTGSQPSEAPTAVDLEPILQKLHTSAKAITETLPSFTCREHIDSRQWKGSVVFRAVQVDTLFRDVRNTDPAAISPFTDSRANPADGSRLDLVSHNPPLPLIVGNMFWVSEQNVAPADRTDMQYKVLSSDPVEPGFEPNGSMHFAFRGTFPIQIHGVESTRRVAGRAWVDRSGRLLRTEVKNTVPSHNPLAPQENIVTTVVDYAPVTLDNISYDLPSRIHVESRNSATTTWSDFTATYSECELFKATVRILPSGSN